MSHSLPVPTATSCHGAQLSEPTLVKHLPELRRIVRMLGRRHRLNQADEGDLLGDAVVHLLAKEGRVLRNFRGASAIGTYLHTVVSRVLLDTRVAAWGKWRPSTRARLAGAAAIQFERLVARDGLSVTEARAVMRHHPRLRLVDEVADAISRSVRAAHTRRALPLPRGLDIPIAPSQEADLQSQALERRALNARAIARRALKGLAADDLALLRLRFVDDRSVADIARDTGDTPKRLYRRCEMVLRMVKVRCEADGLNAEDVRALLGRDTLDSESLL